MLDILPWLYGLTFVSVFLYEKDEPIRTRIALGIIAPLILAWLLVLFIQHLFEDLS